MEYCPLDWTVQTKFGHRRKQVIIIIIIINEYD